MKTKLTTVTSLFIALFGWTCSDQSTAPDTGDQSQLELYSRQFVARTDIGRQYVTETENYPGENKNQTVELVFNAPLQGDIQGQFTVTITSEVNYFSKGGKQSGEGTIELNSGRLWDVTLKGYMAQEKCSGIITAYDRNGNTILRAKYAEDCGSRVGDQSRQLSLQGEIFEKSEVQVDPSANGVF